MTTGGVGTETGVAETRRVVTSVGDFPIQEVGSGAVVLLLNGWPMAPAQWQGLVPQLAARSRVIVPDLTQIPARQGAHATAVRDLLAAEDIDRVSLVGQGAGATVALELLAALPRGVPPVGSDAAILLSPTVPGLWPSPELVEILRARTAEATDDQVRGTIETLLTRGSGATSVIDRSLFEAVCSAWQGEARRQAFVAARPSTADPAEDLDPVWSEALAAIETPVLLLWGEDDPFARADGAEVLHDLIGSATLGLVPGCGHFLVEEAPATVAPMIVEYLYARALGGAHDHGTPGDGPRDGVTLLQLERRPPWVGPADGDRW
jgi:pimeloyl-ACP methyl ester carboxylesterase